MLDFQNKKIFYSMGSGFGVALNKLNAFDRALLSAGCANYNLIRVSSILPANAQMVTGINFVEGSLLPVAFAKKIGGPTEEKLTFAAAVAIGIPDDNSKAGVIMEWSGISDESTARKKVISMVNTAMSDRNILNYSTKVSSIEKESSSSMFTCVFAYVALLPQAQTQQC